MASKSNKKDSLTKKMTNKRMQERNIISGAMATVISPLVEFYYALLPWLILAFVLIIADTRFGVEASIKRGEQFRPSRMMRRMINKFVDYICWITLAGVIGNTFGTVLGIPILSAIILLVVSTTISSLRVSIRRLTSGSSLAKRSWKELLKINRKKMNIKVTASTNRLGETTKKVLTEVGDKAGLEEVVVTSTLRTPLAQAEAMLTNIENNRIIRYKWAGEEVNKLARSLRGKKVERKQIIEAMVAKIKELSKSGNRVSKHCVSEEEYDKCNIIDVSYLAMAEDKREDFLKAMIARKEVTKVIQPISRKLQGYDAGEPAMHFEINQA